MTCETKPEITPEQIEICRQCIMASAKKIWCCKHGFYFNQMPQRITQPQQKPAFMQMASDFTQAMIRWGKSGLSCVTKDEYLRRRSICSECTDGWRCPHCGCMLWAKVALATERCPEGKW